MPTATSGGTTGMGAVPMKSCRSTGGMPSSTQSTVAGLPYRLLQRRDLCFGRFLNSAGLVQVEFGFAEAGIESPFGVKHQVFLDFHVFAPDS